MSLSQNYILTMCLFFKAYIVSVCFSSGPTLYLCVSPQGLHCVSLQGLHCISVSLLQAYSVYDDEIGYCQGQSFLAAVLLLHVSTFVL